jgi:NADP-dependent 3-hydroxy acid dehydrogenase YdfG
MTSTLTPALTGTVAIITVAIITGASSGTGEAAAKELARRGRYVGSSDQAIQELC